MNLVEHRYTEHPNSVTSLTVIMSVGEYPLVSWTSAFSFSCNKVLFLTSEIQDPRCLLLLNPVLTVFKDVSARVFISSTLHYSWQSFLLHCMH